MYFIADSGSTKCDAVFLDGSGNLITTLHTVGLNPQHHSYQWICEKLGEVPEIKRYAPETSKVFFYGAGCSSPKMNTAVERALQQHFKKATVIEVNHDVMASAYAVYRGEPVISCILGTGSNGAYFNGKDLIQGTPSLAYILGDEGSASHIGKQVLTSYYYGKMPLAAREDFKTTYDLPVAELLDRVYRQPDANIFIGGFASFAGKYQAEPFFKEMISECFNSFLENHVLSFPQSKDTEISFIGSIAYHFQGILKICLQRNKLKPGIIVQKPLERLIEYHRKFKL